MQACNVIFAGRLFLYGVLASKRRASRFSHSIYLEESFRDYVEWLLEAIQIRNGISLIVHQTSSYVTLDAYSKGWFQIAPVWGPQFVSQHVKIFTDNIAYFCLVSKGRSAFDNRLRMARLYATLQIHHDYRAEPACLKTKDNWLADAFSRPADPKCQQIIQNFMNEHGARTTQRHIPPEIFSF